MIALTIVRTRGMELIKMTLKIPLYTRFFIILYEFDSGYRVFNSLIATLIKKIEDQISKPDSNPRYAKLPICTIFPSICIAYRSYGLIPISNNLHTHIITNTILKTM